MTHERDRIQENANSYIVKNCPSYATFYPDTGDEPFTACDAKLPSKKCQDCTDCVIKQVIEKCKAKKLDIYNPSIGNEHYALANSVLSTQILQLFDIEEINK